MDHQQKPNWECSAYVELSVPGEDQVWALLADFFSMHKLLPSLEICRQVSGISGEPGCVRYCGSSTGESDNQGNEIFKWATEKLLYIDHTTKCFSYEIVDNNLGYNSYKATMKVRPRANSNEGGCRIEWSFVIDPAEGQTYEDMVSHQEKILKAIAKSIEEAHQDDK